MICATKPAKMKVIALDFKVPLGLNLNSIYTPI
jgi:hypothetical protein